MGCVLNKAAAAPFHTPPDSLVTELFNGKQPWLMNITKKLEIN